MPRTIDRGRWKLFLSKAEEFLRGARESHARGDWNASVSSAVHAGILACDVITVGIMGVRNTGEHDEIVQLVSKAYRDPPKELPHVRRRVVRLLQVKNLAEYEDRSVDAGDAKTCLTNAERLVEFARRESSRF